MDIKVLGTGCTRCKKLYVEAERALVEAGVEADLGKVEKVAEIASYGVPLTPALVIDGQVLCAGRVASAGEIAGWIREAAAAQGLRNNS